MNNDYVKLELKMVKYRDLVNIPVVENDEPFVSTNFGNNVFVRQAVLEKLQVAQNILQKDYPRLTLSVTCGYRSMEVQTRWFLQRLKICSNKYFEDPVDLYEEVNRSVAVPKVAGHPTGGAVDVIIELLDFGSKQYDYTTKDYYVFSPNISKEAQSNRLLLRKIMMKAGFAPFDGEWWHFSYGDCEWAYYYKRKNAIYGQLKGRKSKLK